MLAGRNEERKVTMRMRALAILSLGFSSLFSQAADSHVLSGAEYYRLNLKARDALNANKLAEAAELYERLLSAYPGNGDSWEKLGSCYERLGRFPNAATAYQHALNLAVGSRAYIENQIAEMWGRAGERAKALEWIKKANADAFERRSGILSDQAFSNWKNDPEFINVGGQTKPLNLNRDDRWRFDLDFLQSEIRRLHYRYRWDSLPTSITTMFSALRADISGLSDEQIVVRIQRILAQLGDGHSVVYFFGGDHGLKRLPLNLYFFSDGLYVMHASPEYKDLVGYRVVKIGDLDPETIVQRLAPYVTRDNEIQSRAMGVYFITTPEFLREIGAVRDVDRETLTLQGANGETKVVSVPSQAGGDLIRSLVPPESPNAPPLYLTRLDEAYWFVELPEAKAVYFQFHHVMNAPGEDLEAFAARLKRFLDEKRPDNLIIDVRHNNGGNAQLLPPLLRTLVQFEGSKPKPQIYIISGRTTYSACQIFIAQAEMLTHAVFVGEPSASSPNFIGEDVPVTLPFSDLMLSISTRYHEGNASDPWIWIPPTIPVSLSSKDYFANRDPALQSIAEVIKGE